MAYFRGTWPNERITPKLHLLECHATNFIRKWGGGFGLYGEQGAESIHPQFNQLLRTYCGIKPSTRRLELMLKEHLMKVNPKAQKLRPEIKKRKFKE